mmetsp:Transcript_22046/g.39056  ORF Transcript_22046/g.39056 Transcript_22046/m.39056 type:complete len:159 (+) Transcript_22046:452-928(+)
MVTWGFGTEPVDGSLAQGSNTDCCCFCGTAARLRLGQLLQLTLGLGEGDEEAGDAWRLGTTCLSPLELRERTAELRREQRLCLLALRAGDRDAPAGEDLRLEIDGLLRLPPLRERAAEPCRETRREQLRLLTLRSGERDAAATDLWREMERLLPRPRE